MSWRITIVHTTEHRYAEDVRASYNEARVRPLQLPSQTCMEARVDVEPAVRLFQYVDYWGTSVTSFNTQAPHRSLIVTGRSIVETFLPPRQAVAITWPELGDEKVVDTFAEFLAPTAYVPPLPSAVAELRATEPRRPLDAAHEACEWARDRLRYQPGVTNVRTSAAEALQQGHGVCQDFAHLALGVLRGMGIPARYVSGYLHPQADADIGDTIEGQSHAWVEWWCGKWVGWDPTHGVPAGERHVVIGRGRDYADVPPLKGIFQGPPAIAHEVRVAITRTI
jgi:transglutaminase-like putative cysteine protease